MALVELRDNSGLPEHAFVKLVGPLRLKPDGLLHGKQFAEDPLVAYGQFLKPYMDKTYGDDLTGRSAFLSWLGGNANIGRDLSIFDTQQSKLEKDRRLYGQAHPERAQSFVDNSWSAQVEGFKNQWTNLMVALGAPSVGTATAAMKSFNEGMGRVVTTIAGHPDVVRTLVAVSAGLGGLAVVAGGIGLTTAFAAFLPGTAFALGAAALVTTVSMAAAANWKGISDSLEKANPNLKALPDGENVISLLWKSVSDGAAATVAGIKAGLDRTWTAAHDGFARFFDMLSNAISKAFSAIGNILPAWLKNDEHSVRVSQLGDCHLALAANQDVWPNFDR